MPVLNFFKIQKKSLSLVFFLALASSIYVFIDHKTNNYFLVSIIIYLPFIWISFGLTLIYIIILHILKVNRKIIFQSLPFFFFAGIFGSMFITFYIMQEKSRGQVITQVGEEAASCLKNYKQMQNVYKINNILATPVYNSKNKVTGFTLGFTFTSSRTLYVNIVPDIHINGSNPFYTEGKIANARWVKEGVPQEISVTLNKGNPKDIELIRKSMGPIESYISVSVYDLNGLTPNIIFLPKRPRSDNLCDMNVRNRRERPVYDLPELKLKDYKPDDF